LEVLFEKPIFGLDGEQEHYDRNTKINLPRGVTSKEYIELHPHPKNNNSKPH
jgi:hypothetical protein